MFIEGNVPDAGQLAAGVAQGTLAVILDPEGDGVAQIAAFLASHDIGDLSAIDIVAHGADGAVQLGTGTLSAASLAGYQTDLATIGAALRPGGAIQIYGCDVAQDAAGVAFLSQLSAATGGANIAAASHLVGAASGGGSWDLNVNTGSIDAGSPFTAAAEQAYPAELPTLGTSDLFLAFNVDYIDGGASIERMSVSGGSTATGVTSLASSADNPSFSDASGLLSMVVEDPQSKYYVVDDDSATGHGATDAILVGTFGTAALASPSYLNFASSSSISPWGIAESSNPNILYIANYDGANAALNGIWQINVTNGSVSPVAVSSLAAGPDLLAIDQQNSLGFFTDDFNSDSQLEVGNLATGGVQVLYSVPSDEILYGIAVNAGTVYFDSGYDESINGVYAASYTLSGGSVTLGTIHTLYSLASGGAVNPMGLAIDPSNGVFYVGNDEDSNNPTWSVWEGSLAGSTAQANMVEVYTSGTNAIVGPETDALDIQTTPTITTGGTVAYTRGNAAATLALAGATVVNPDGVGLAGATVTIVSGSTNDVLSATVAGTSITASYTAATETLTLSGADTAADYQTVLDSVKFSTTAAGGTRTIHWTVTDGVLNSATATSTVIVANGETIKAGATASFSGGGSPVPLDSGVTVVDSGSSTLVSATVIIGGFITGDALTAGTLGGLSQTFGGGTLTLSGTASLATYQTALDSVEYGVSPGNTDPTGGGTHTTRAISWTINDGVVSSAAATSTLDTVHTAPTIVTGGTVSFTGGGSAVALDPGLTVSDVDSGGVLSSATVTVAGAITGDTLNFTNSHPSTEGNIALASDSNGVLVLTLRGHHGNAAAMGNGAGVGDLQLQPVGRRSHRRRRRHQPNDRLGGERRQFQQWHQQHQDQHTDHEPRSPNRDRGRFSNLHARGHPRRSRSRPDRQRSRQRRRSDRCQGLDQQRLHQQRHAELRQSERHYRRLRRGHADIDRRRERQRVRNRAGERDLQQFKRRSDRGWHRPDQIDLMDRLR